jgi:hypothetical protein
MRMSQTRGVVRRGLVLAAVVGLAVSVGLTAPRRLSASGSRVCSNATLRGDYGFIASGVKAVPPPPFGAGGTERFTASGIWSFDGSGTLTHAPGAGLHGEVTGTNPDSTGLTAEYEVNPNCTGTITQQVPGVPIALHWTMVIVGSGREVKAANTTGLSTVELTRR